MTSESIAAGLDAVARRRWTEGYELLSVADAEGTLDGAGLDALADAAFALGHHEKARAAHERAYTVHAQEDDASTAAASAIKLGVIFVRRGEIPRVMGWLSSAERRLEGQPESVGHGLDMDEGHVRRCAGRPRRSRGHGGPDDRHRPSPG